MSVEGSEGCPSVLDVARFESGDLPRGQRAVIKRHAHQCSRCTSALQEIRRARSEILGETAGAQSDRSRLAAETIQGILRQRVH
jgi:hypothetical protein